MRWILLLLWLAPLAAQPSSLSAARIRAHTRFLSSGLLEGRAPGARGGALAEEYIAAQFALAGLRPAAPGGSYFQSVPLRGVRTLPATTLSVEGRGGALNLRWREDFAGSTHTQAPLVSLQGEVVFAGYGIRAPEYQWDDYRGGAVRGKVALLLAGEPASTSRNFFAGEAPTYYSRWNYKFEEALRQGARAVLLVHSGGAVPYTWPVLLNFWAREETQAPRPAGQPALDFAGWVHRDAAARVLALAGLTIEEATRRASARDFRPVETSLRLEGRIESAIRSAGARNVAAWIPGEDLRLRDEFVAFSAHWDHLGTDPESGAVFPGAVDNASGCAILLEVARHWAAQDRKPPRSALFLALTAEESNLLGERFYVNEPLRPLSKTALLLNFDAIHPSGLLREVALHGAPRETILPLAELVAERLRLTVTTGSQAEQGGDYRSDHFPFARAGVAAFSLRPGAGLHPSSTEAAADFAARRYHTPLDAFDENWDFAGPEQVARFAFALGYEAACGALQALQ